MATTYRTINVDEEAAETFHCWRFVNKLIRIFSHFPKVYLAAIAALLNIVNLGMVTSYAAPATISMMETYSRIHVNPEQISWIASMGAISAMFGSPLSGFLSHWMGRKAVLMHTSLPFLVGWLMIAYAPSISWIYAGRLLTGFCCGLVSVTVPTYVVEISTPTIRGFLGTGFNTAFATGVLLSMAFGMYIAWSWLAVIGGFLSGLTALLLLFMPESPHWLICKGYGAQAVEAITFLRGDAEQASIEVFKLTKEIELERQIKITLKEFFTSSVLYKPTFLAVLLMFFQQFCGINALVAYTVAIFENAGTSFDLSSATIIVSSTQVVSTVICSLLIDKVGRRPLFSISGVFVSVGLIILGLFSYLTSHHVISSVRSGWMSILGFIIFLAAFSLGYGPIPWVMAPEMVPTEARSIVVAIASVCTNLFMFVVVKTYENLRVTLNDYGLYWLYASFALLGCLFCYFCLPETKGKPLKEIQTFFRSRKMNNESQKLLPSSEIIAQEGT